MLGVAEKYSEKIFHPSIHTSMCLDQALSVETVFGSIGHKAGVHSHRVEMGIHDHRGGTGVHPQP